MTQEEKQLLLKDLCARFPYGVKVRISSESDVCLYVTTDTLDIDNLHKYMLNGGYYKNGLFYKTPGFQLLPYLRPMSSMTQEERLIYEQRLHDVGRSIDVIDADDVVPHIDWLLSHHFDFRGLIPMGLALEALPGMYKTE